MNANIPAALENPDHWKFLWTEHVGPASRPARAYCWMSIEDATFLGWYCGRIEDDRLALDYMLTEKLPGGTLQTRNI